MYDSDYREANITGLETATPLVEQGADSPGAFDVPATAKKITEIRITTGISCADDTAFGWSSSIHVHGSGVQLGEGWFPGPVGTVEGIAAASGSKFDSQVQRYLTNIPVKAGGKFSIDGFMLGEDVGALHMIVTIVYDGPVVGKIIDMDYRSIDLTAANTLVRLTERGAAVVEGDIKPSYGEIGEIFMGAGAKITASAAEVVGLAFHLSGPGLKTTGNYKFGTGFTWGLNTELSGSARISALERFVCGIKTKQNNAITIQGQMIEGDVGTAFAIVGFAYY